MKISGGLDNTWLMNVRGAVGGVLDTRYYLHLRVPGRNETRLLVYDTERRLCTRRTRRQKRMLPAGRCAPQGGNSTSGTA